MRYVFYTFLCLLLYAFQSATAQINVEKLPNRVDQTNPPTITSVELTSKLVKSKEGTIIDTAKLIQSPPQPVAPEYTENKGVQNSGTMDSATRKLREIAISSYYHSIEAQNKASQQINDSLAAYYAWAFKNRQQVLLQQQKTSSIIFYMVLLLVLCGLIFSGIQFYIALSGSKKRVVMPDTSIKASLTGVEVSSSLLGILLLTLSLAFFYLYLVKVYPLVSVE